MKPSTYYTLGQAAKAVGKSKPTLLHAIKTGKFSYVEKTSDGYKIDPAELHRVYPPVNVNLVDEVEELAGGVDGLDASYITRIKELEAQLEITKERLEEQKNRVQDKEAQVEDLKQERDSWRKQATYLLEDKSEKEEVLSAHLQAEQELREKLVLEKAQQEQAVQRMAEMQSSLEKVRNSWIGRLFFKV